MAVCRKRRKEKATIQVEASNQKTTEAVVLRTTESHQTYYKHEKETLNQLEENNQGRISSEYDTLNENNAPVSSGTGNLYDRANFNVGNSTYDVTFSTNNPRQAVQANSYDHVRLKKTNDGKCNHVDLQDERNSAHEIDTYDQTNSLAFDKIYYDTIQETFKLHQQSEENVILFHKGK
ncbi:hypothetical protein CHS0354_012392 [Potamilus streckersoni]|uniref:Uncharacterized protein n=1 Tax=Potamilus streckersoni TaxID=2493646 RepID=A0AAE0RYS6_9BIVA|nr:hypothetical protein CHS0354_012392 [Potamilus streckersoni]